MTPAASSSVRYWLIFMRTASIDSIWTSASDALLFHKALACTQIKIWRHKTDIRDVEIGPHHGQRRTEATTMHPPCCSLTMNPMCCAATTGPLEGTVRDPQCELNRRGFHHSADATSRCGDLGPRYARHLGTEFLTQVQQEFPDTVRFILTGKNAFDTAQHALHRGIINQCLIKPCNRADLSEAIRRELAQRQPQPELSPAPPS